MRLPAQTSLARLWRWPELPHVVQAVFAQVGNGTLLVPALPPPVAAPPLPPTVAPPVPPPPPVLTAPPAPAPPLAVPPLACSVSPATAPVAPAPPDDAPALVPPPEKAPAAWPSVGVPADETEAPAVPSGDADPGLPAEPQAATTAEEQNASAAIRRVVRSTGNLFRVRAPFCLPGCLRTLLNGQTQQISSSQISSKKRGSALAD